MPAPDEARSETLPASVAAELARHVETSTGLLLGLDFDGTLAPIDSDPDAPTLDPAMAPPLDRLAQQPEVDVAIVSGRQVDDLVDRVGISGLAYAGNHGLELHRNGRTVVHPTAGRQRPAIRRACERVADRLATVPGWEIEDKGVTATVHYRRVPADRVPEIASAVETAVAESTTPLVVTRGKEILEIRPAIDWDKGRLLDLLAGEAPPDWATVYVGDDTTDEDAFRVVEPQGLGVRVGDPEEETVASAVLPARRQVRSLLRVLDERMSESDVRPPRKG